MEYIIDLNNSLLSHFFSVKINDLEIRSSNWLPVAFRRNRNITENSKLFSKLETVMSVVLVWFYFYIKQMSTIYNFTLNSAYQICYEHAFNNPIEHKPGTNKYTYQYPDHWIQYPGRLHSVAVRSVTVKPAARDIAFRNLFLKRKEQESELDIGINVECSLSYGEDMNRFNERMKDEMKYLFENYKLDRGSEKLEWLPSDVRIFYRYSKNELVFKITNETHYFLCNDDGENAVYTSDDFKSLVGIKDDLVFRNIARYQLHDDATFEEVPGVEVRFRGDTKQVTRIVFKNVWNRSQLTVNSSFSSLAEQHFLTLSNVINPIPKYFEINGFKTDFSIYLYDACLKSPVELPLDGKDLMLVELLLVAQ